MAGYEYGQVSEATKKTKMLVERVADLGSSESQDVAKARELLRLIEDEHCDVDDVFVASAKNLLEDIVADGQIDPKERVLLKSLSDTLNDPISDEVPEEIAGSSFVFTGDFVVEGGKDTAKEMTRAAGGLVKSGVSKKTDYVVVGGEGSSAWAFGTFGTKIMKALELRLTGKSDVKIISEDAFVRAVEERSPDAAEVVEKKSERFEQQWSSAKVVDRGFEGLTDGQQRVFDLVKQGHNVYLTGLGGTGKSYVLGKIIEWAQRADKNVIVCAPTGIAALNVGGSTIHRVLGIGPNKILQNPIPYIPDGSPLPKCDLMIVDEISMCRMDLFDYLSKVLDKVVACRKEEGKPRCQLVVVGDFCQLPPVVRKEEKPILDARYGFDVRGAYPFMGTEWDSWGFEKIELTEAVRQRDADFVAALNACRVGDIKGVKWIKRHAAKLPAEKAITLCGTNSQAGQVNSRHLALLESNPATYHASVDGEVVEQDMQTSQALTLKVGARVMALVNQSESTYMNGTLGTVVDCKKDGVVVDFDDSGRSFVGEHTWEVTKPVLENGRTRGQTIGTFRQIPLKLAWAITIHKAQGQTFCSATIYPKCWENGQLYTALSRLTNVEGMYLAYEVSDDFLQTSSDVLAFLDGNYCRPFSGADAESKACSERDESKCDDVKRELPSAGMTALAGVTQDSPGHSLDGSFAEIHLSASCGRNVLERQGIDSVRRLVGMSAEDLASIKGMGEGKISNLTSSLKRQGVLAEGSSLPLTEAEFLAWNEH